MASNLAPHDWVKGTYADKSNTFASETYNPVSQSELSSALDNVAWEIAQKIADELPPYLEDEDLTAERFYQRNKDKMSKKESFTILDRLVSEGILEKQERRRKGKSGGRAIVYVKVNHV